jgi:hypothetical protein
MSDLAQRILARHQAGKTYQAIAAELGCHEAYVRTALRRLGLVPLGKRGIIWHYARSQ